ncbi:MAG: hypothetical protein J6T56_08360 [Bacteroidales bacterium]|nr:hypothetical protein [Bacteroidales bacterium]MBP5614218.1 hypothetical protein [Bacteroidales bacterium]
METTENIKAQFQSGTVSEVRKNLFGFLYQPTGSRIRYHEASIDQKDASQLTRFLEQHDPALLRGIRLQPLGSHRLQCYLCKKHEAAWVQLSEFVPYRYVPLTGVVKLEGAAAAAIAEILVK